MFVDFVQLFSTLRFSRATATYLGMGREDTRQVKARQGTTRPLQIGRQTKKKEKKPWAGNRERERETKKRKPLSGARCVHACIGGKEEEGRRKFVSLAGLSGYCALYIAYMELAGYLAIAANFGA